MPTAEESHCCHEIYKTYDKITVFNEALQCINDHLGLPSVCLDPYILETAYYQYRQQYDQHMEDSNERRQYVAYWQFVRWCWGFFDKEVRVPVPACAVYKIRHTFPSDTYVGFKWLLNIETSVKTQPSLSQDAGTLHTGEEAGCLMTTASLILRSF